MERKGLREKIFSDAAHHHSIRGEKLVPIHEGRPVEGHWVVPFCHDKHANESLVPVDNEITSEFGHIFSLLHKLQIAEAIKVTEGTPYHHWNVSET